MRVEATITVLRQSRSALVWDVDEDSFEVRMVVAGEVWLGPVQYEVALDKDLDLTDSEIVNAECALVDAYQKVTQ